MREEGDLGEEDLSTKRNMCLLCPIGTQVMISVWSG